MGSTTGLFVLALLACSSAFFVPAGKQLVYEYEAIVKAGTLIPTNHASQFMLRGKLNLNCADKVCHVFLADLKYQLYNGVMNHHDELLAKELDAPSEVADLMKPFAIKYDADGKVVEIMVEESEHLWAVNIKKSIATILQLEGDKIMSEKKPHGFTSFEQSIYGVSRVLYNVLPKSDDVMEVQKMLVIPTNQKIMRHSIKEVDPEECDAPHQAPYSRDSQRKYLLVADEGHKIVKRVEANGGIYYHPFEGKSEAQYLFVNQTMEFISKVDAKPIATPSKVIKDLSYTIFDETAESEGVPSLALGRRVYDSKKLIAKVMLELEGVMSYMKANHIHMNIPNFKEGQKINKLKEMMMHLDIKGMEELYTLVLTKPTHIQEIYHQLLPIVGTRASLHCIMKCMENDKIDDNTLTDMLQDMPKHIVAPNQVVLTEMEKLMTLNKDWEVQKSAILAFSNIVSSSHKFQQKMYKYRHFNEFFDEKEFETEVPSSKDIEKKFEKYVTMFVEKVKSAKTYKERLVYFSALSNMGLDSMIPHLIPIIRGEVFPDHHIRLWAMWTLSSVAEGNHEETYDLLWPILSNTKEHTELRIVAYWIIMETIPYKTTFMNMYWTLKNDPCMELYHFHYTYLQSLSNRADRCYGDMKIWARQLLRYMNPPTHGVSEYDLIDFEDIKYGFGMGLHGVFIRSNDSIIINGIQTSQIFNLFHTDYVVNIKINGIKRSWDLFTLNTKSNDRLMTFNENVLNIINLSPELEKDMHIEVVLMKDNQIVDTMFIDFEQLAMLKKMPVMKWWKEGSGFSKKQMSISYDMYAKTLIPTDMGMPALLIVSVPEVHLIDMKFNKETVDKVMKLHIDGSVKTWAHAKHGLTVYNPIADAMQGINKYHSYDSMIPLLMDVSVNTQQGTIKFSVGKHNDATKDLMGLRSHVASIVFMNEQGKATSELQLSSPSSKHHVMVTRGEKHRHNYPLSYHEDSISGRNWEIQVYDSEIAVSNGTFNHARHMFYQPYTKHFKTPFQHMFLSALNMDAYIDMMPMPKTHGLFVRVWPKNDVSNVDLTIRFDRTILSREFIYAPAMKVNAKVTYAVKNAEKSLKTWDMNAVWERNDGHSVNALKMVITRIIPGQKDYKVCVDGTRKWNLKGVTGHLNIGMGQSADDKCVLDDTTIEITMTGEKSEEQLAPSEHSYHSCEYPMPYSVSSYKTMNCLYAMTSIRKYVYDIKTNKVPNEFKKNLIKVLDVVKSEHMPFFQWVDEHHEKIGEQNLKIEVTYPMSRSVVDIEVFTNQHLFSMTGLPISTWAFYGFHPDSLQYPKMMHVFHNMGKLHFSKIDMDSQVWNKISNKKDWSMIIGNDATKPTQALFVQEVSENVMGIKIQDAAHTMILTPDHVKIDGQDGKWMESLDWVFWNNLEHEDTHKVALMLPHSGLFIIYDGRSMMVLRPPVDFEWHGLAMH
ncbi:unnamed protein product [Brassicogethes aeneus]|uniref:Vitellogenin domain-containing protein n=1 Tax=Brassicogethes aeneus TaxID=1431903 RepID=A0A9P0B995_BRAAE|nr:unnamed protein product [Brassicogethes aeneus]